MDKLILPDYSRNQCAVAAEILKRFGVNNGNSSLNIINQSKKKLSLVVVDGLGWNLFSKTNVPNGIEARKITSVFPSTTATSIVSLMTGLSPGSHGIIGYRSFLKEVGSLVKMLEFTYAPSHSDHLLAEISEIEQMFNVKNIFMRLRQKHVKSAVLIPDFLVNTSYSKLIYRGAYDIQGYSNIWEAFLLYRKLLENPRIRFISMYIPDVDTIQHAYGFDSDISRESASYILNKLYSIHNSKRRYADAIITSDHGHITLGKRIDMKANRALNAKLDIPPYGDGRAPLFRSRENIAQELSQYNLRTFGRKDFSALFGKIDDVIAPSMPDVVGVPLDDSYYEYDFKLKPRRYPSTMKSNHGGLSAHEMEIPLLVID
jgi:hypothetical protein